jgi:uncharacterized membrane protein
MSSGDLSFSADVLASEDARLAANKRLTLIVYALQALGFVSGVTYIAAVVVNYVKRDEVEGTWLASHFRWQIRTFWFSALWMALGVIGLMIVIGYFGIIANMIWVIYRITKGFLRFNDGKPMYAKP